MNNEWQPKCPYLAAIGIKYVTCELHAHHKGKHEFENKEALRHHMDSICYKDFDQCETYRKTYLEEMRSIAPSDLEYRKCAYCCNNSGYIGLKTHDGSTHGFCQLKQEDMPKYDTKTVCEYFNKLYREGECPYYNGVCQDGRKPQIRCGSNALLTYFDESKEDRDKHVVEICRGQMDTCRAFLFRQLERAGAGPRSDHSTEELREMYLKLNGSEEVGKKKQDIENVAAPCPHNRGIIKEGKYWIRNCARDPMQQLKYESKNQAEALSKTCRGEEDFSMCRFYGEGKCFNARCPFHHSELWVSEKCDLEEIAKTKPHLIQEYGEEVLEYCPMPEKLRELLSRNPIICTTRENEGTGCVPNNPEAGMCAAYEKKGGEENKMNELKVTPNSWSGRGSDFVERFMKKDGNAAASNPVQETDENACPYGKHNTGDCRCIGFDGECQVIRRKDWDRYWFVKEMQGKVECEIFNKYAAEIIAEKRPKEAETLNEITETVNNSSKIVAFDYSTVDEDTAAFLREKARKIVSIRTKAMIDMAIELEEVHKKLASHYQGTFGAWCESIGITDRTARNYLTGLEWVRKNFPNIDDARNIQTSLLFEASKPSAPKELQEAVLSGDITTHKQYKELEEKLRKAEERAERAVNQKFVAENKAIEAEQRCRKAEKDKDDSIRALKKDINNLQQQLEQAKRNSDPAKVQELGEIIARYQKDIEALEADKKTLNQEINSLRKQLKEKPIEAQSVKVVEEKVVEKEVIPEEVALAIYDKIARLYEGLTRLTDKEIQVFAEQVDPDYFDDIARDLDEATEVLAKIEHAARKAIESNPIHPADDPICACGTCSKSDPDYDAEKLENESLTWCPVHQRYVHTTDETCDEFESYLEGR